MNEFLPLDRSVRAVGNRHLSGSLVVPGGAHAETPSAQETPQI